MLVMTLLRRYVPLLKALRVPTALLAGFFLLILYETQQLPTTTLESITFHCFNLSFIAIILKRPQKFGSQVIANSTAVFMQYGLQGFFGLLVGYLVASMVYPELSLGFGILLPLGFALGPGPAFSLGKTFETLGFESAATMGIFMSSIGYLVASTFGIILIQWAKKKNILDLTANTLLPQTDAKPSPSKNPSKENNAHDSSLFDVLSLHVCLVFIVYGINYAFLTLLTSGLNATGNPALSNLTETLWSLSFLFSALWALVTRGILQKTGAMRAFQDQHFIRISGITMDYVIVASVASISLAVIGKYWFGLLLLSLLGIFLVTLPLLWVCSRLFKNFTFFRTLMIFGVSSGTLTIALALLRIVDPEYKTPAISDYMYSMGFNFLFSIPLILILNTAVPSRINGDLRGFFIVLFVCLAYVVVCFLLTFLFGKKRIFQQPGTIWLKK